MYIYIYIYICSVCSFFLGYIRCFIYYIIIRMRLICKLSVIAAPKGNIPPITSFRFGFACGLNCMFSKAYRVFSAPHAFVALLAQRRALAAVWRTGVLLTLVFTNQIGPCCKRPQRSTVLKHFCLRISKTTVNINSEWKLYTPIVHFEFLTMVLYILPKTLQSTNENKNCAPKCCSLQTVLLKIVFSHIDCRALTGTDADPKETFIGAPHKSRF